MIAVNLQGTFNTLREAARRLRSGGRIINFSTSVVGLLLPTYGIYAATKAAVEVLTSVLSKELRGRSITVNCVAPGFIQTAMTDVLPEEQKQKLLGAIPLGRLGAGADIAAAVLYLASEEAGYVTGQTLHVNGGMAMI